MSLTGLVNSDAKVATVGNATYGNWTGGTTTTKQMSSDVNNLISLTWAASGYAFVPGKLLLPPAKFSFLVDQDAGVTGYISVLEWIKRNNTYTAQTGKELDIQPCKWLTGAGAMSTDRMVAYTNDKMLVRFPMVPLQRTPLEYRGLMQLTTYFGKLGSVEFVYGESVGYADGI